MNPALKDAIVETCLEACRLMRDRKGREAIAVLREVHGLMALDRQIEATEVFP